MLIVILFWTVLGFPSAFLFRLKTKNLFTRPKLFMNLDWVDDEGERIQPLPELSAEVLNILNQELHVIASNAAISTVSYYMTEFHDDMTQKWMVQFKDYKSEGFENDDWTTYITEMIKLDKQEVNVYLNPPKKMGKLNAAPNAKIRLKYVHEIQPRKVAHQLVTVREDVCLEMMQDLGSIKVENKEALKCAQARLLHGKDYADKHRNPTRNSDMGGSTPLRNRNYNTCAILITNLALDLVRKELIESGEMQSKERLDKLVSQMVAETEALSPAERLVRQTMYGTGPKWLIEELLFISFTEETGTSKFIKMAERLLSTRLALAIEGGKILAAQNLDSRKYFKMIKDFGGFNKLEFGKSKVTVVDMDEEMAKIAAEDAAKEAAALAAAAAAATAAADALLSNKEETQEEVVQASAAVAAVENAVAEAGAEEVEAVEETDIWSDSFFGPIAM